MRASNATSALPPTGRTARCSSARRSFACPHREEDLEAAPLARLAAHGDGPAVLVDDLLRDAETETGAFGRRFRGEERLPDPFEQTLLETSPGVRHGNLDELPAGGRARPGGLHVETHPDATARLRCLNCVHDEVRHGLLELRAVEPRLDLASPLEGEAHAALQRQRLEEGKTCAEDVCNGDHLLARLAASRVVENTPHDARDARVVAMRRWFCFMLASSSAASRFKRWCAENAKTARMPRKRPRLSLRASCMGRPFGWSANHAGRTDRGQTPRECLQLFYAMPALELGLPPAEGERGECWMSSTDGTRWTRTAPSHPDI